MKVGHCAGLGKVVAASVCAHLSREQRAFSSSSLSPRQSLQDKKADLDPPSLHRKIPFPTRMSETGSMTGWWVFSLCPTTFHHPVSANRTIPIRRKIGRFSGDLRLLTSRTLVSVGRSPALAAVFGALSPHPKIPFPAAGLGREIRPARSKASDAYAKSKAGTVRMQRYASQ